MFCLFIFLTSKTVKAFDLYKALSLPNQPLALKKDRLEEKNSKLAMATSREEVYRKWVDGEEVSRLDASRSAISLDLNVFSSLYLYGHQLFQARQTLMNKDIDKATGLSMKNMEERKDIGISYRGRQNFCEAAYRFYGDYLSGNLQLEDSARDAIGGNPDVSIRSKHFARQFKWIHRSEDFVAKVGISWSESGQKAIARPTGMTLDIPLDMAEKEQDFELNILTSKPVFPFFRYSSSKIHGYGESYRDKKFRFGFTRVYFGQTVKAAGLIFQGQHPWFIEFQKFSLTSDASFRNNLITLNPIMLFSTNEILQSERLLNTNPNGYRIGGIRNFRNVSLYLQYGLMDIRAERVTAQNKISNFRKDEKDTLNFSSEKIRFHRLNSELEKKDKAGSWKLIANFMVPETISQKEEDGAYSSTGPSPAPAALKKSSKVRGGWQISLIRELHF
jgi:hypothetical protein